jgi:2-keto-3-deoxy-6-phosphogluconate aldolase
LALGPDFRQDDARSSGRRTIVSWLAAGADGFGLGSALYKAGMSAAAVDANARAFAAAWQARGAAG